MTYTILALRDTQGVLTIGGRTRGWKDLANLSTAAVSIPANVNYACDVALRRLSRANCERPSFEFLGSQELVLDPSLPPVIKVVGKLGGCLVFK